MEKNALCLRTRDLTVIAACAALMAVCAWIAIPTDPPFTLQTMAVFLTVGVLGGKRGTIAVGLYLLMGAVGLPVFSGSHTLSCNGDQTKSKGIPRQICDSRQIIGHCIAGQGRRSQGRNQALKRQLPHLENTVFQPVGNPHSKDSPDHLHFRFKLPYVR